MNYESARFDAELSDFHVALVAVFLADGAVLGVRTGCVLHGSAHILEAGHQGLLLHSVVVQSAAVRLGLEDGVRKHEGSQHKSLHAVVLPHSLKHCQLQQVFAHAERLVALAGEFTSFLGPAVGHSLEDLEWGGEVEVEMKCQEDLAFHGLELGEGVRRVGNFYVVAHAGRVDLLVLAGDPQAGDANQLVLVLSDVVHCGISIEVGEGEEERLLPEFEGEVDVDHPVHQDLPHLSRDVPRQLQVLLPLNQYWATCRLSMKERISPQYSVMGSRASCGRGRRSKECDLWRAEAAREGFSLMEAFLGRRGSRLVMSLPKTRLGGTFLRRIYISPLYETNDPTTNLHLINGTKYQDSSHPFRAAQLPPSRTTRYARNGEEQLSSLISTGSVGGDNTGKRLIAGEEAQEGLGRGFFFMLEVLGSKSRRRVWGWSQSRVRATSSSKSSSKASSSWDTCTSWAKLWKRSSGSRSARERVGGRSLSAVRGSWWLFLLRLTGVSWAGGAVSWRLSITVNNK